MVASKYYKTLNVFSLQNNSKINQARFRSCVIAVYLVAIGGTSFPIDTFKPRDTNM